MRKLHGLLILLCTLFIAFPCYADNELIDLYSKENSYGKKYQMLGIAPQGVACFIDTSSPMKFKQVQGGATGQCNILTLYKDNKNCQLLLMINTVEMQLKQYNFNEKPALYIKYTYTYTKGNFGGDIVDNKGKEYDTSPYWQNIPLDSVVGYACLKALDFMMINNG